MPTYYFVGGEDGDFQRIGAGAINTANAAARRTAYARCAVAAGNGTTTDGWMGTLTTPVTSFWWTGRFYINNLSSASTTYDFVAFADGSTRRLIISVESSIVPRLRINKQSAALTRTILATGTNLLTVAFVFKLDVQVISYGVASTVNVYVDGVLWVTYTGDVTTDGATSLSSFVAGVAGPSSQVLWSEVICADVDTRPLSLVTLPAAANGNTFAWTGSTANISPAVLDDLTTISSGTANQVAQSTVTSTGITGTPAVLAVAVNARAMRGATGPANIQASVRTASTDYFSSNIALTPTWEKASNVWTLNPNTSAAWAPGDLTAAGFNIGVKSIT